MMSLAASVLSRPPAVATLSDDALLAEQASLAAERRRVDARLAAVAGEIARRSSRSFGYAGLATRQGARSPQELVQRIAGVTGREALALTRVGELLTVDEGEQPAEEWLRATLDAVRRGDLGVEAADAIRAGLGEPSDTVTADDLAAIADRLIEEAARIGVDRLAARAREERDAVDDAGVAERERARRERRYLKLSPQWDGMTKIHGLLDPESAALVTSAFDRITAPRRHGPRFVDPTEQAREAAIIADPRSTGQLVHDAFIEMINVAVASDTGILFGARRPAVRVHAALDAVQRRTGTGRIEGQTDAVSIHTVERHVCDSGMIPIVFDDHGQPINLGRTQRLFTPRQRIALAARDGGCRFPGCDRPPEWTEAHHPEPWSEGGTTDISNGILLCRFHHMLVHNEGWRVILQNGEYHAVPPPSRGDRTPIPMPSHNKVRLRR